MPIIAKTKDYLKNKDLCGLYDFIINNQIDKETASTIFSLIYDYTSSFRNSNTCSNAMNIAGKLIDIGVPHDRIVLEKTKKSLSKMKFIGEILKITVKFNFGKVIGGVIDSGLFKKYNETEETLENIVLEIIFSVKNVESAIFFIKDDKGFKNFIRLKDETNTIDIENLKNMLNNKLIKQGV